MEQSFVAFELARNKTIHGWLFAITESNLEWWFRDETHTGNSQHTVDKKRRTKELFGTRWEVSRVC